MNLKPFSTLNLLLLLACLYPICSAHAANRCYPDIDGVYSYYVGQIGNTQKIQMALNRERHKVNGEFFYVKDGSLIILKGRADDRDYLITEYGVNEGSPAKARFRLKLDAADRLTGSWESIDGKQKLPVQLNEVARSNVIKLDPDKRDYYMAARFPGLVPVGPPGKLKAFKQAIQGHFLNNIQAMDKKWVKGEGLRSYEETAAIRYFSPDLVSLQVHKIQGGWLRPIHFYHGLNYQLVDGKVRELKLSDLFDQKTAWKRELPLLVGRVLPAVLSREKKEGHLIFLESVPKVIGDLKLDLLEQFSVSPAGIEFHLPSIYSSPRNGSHHVTLSFELLKPYLLKNGTLARWTD